MKEACPSLVKLVFFSCSQICFSGVTGELLEVKSFDMWAGGKMTDLYCSLLYCRSCEGKTKQLNVTQSVSNAKMYFLDMYTLF